MTDRTLRYIKCILVSGCFLFIAVTVKSQHYEIVKHLTTKEGLSSNNIYNAFQDSKGFLWFCSDQGVMKYDGKDFKYFGIKEGLTTNDIFNFFEDKYGRLWLYTYDGSLTYIQDNEVHNEFNKYNRPVDPELKQAKITLMAQDIDDSGFYIFKLTMGYVIKIQGNRISYIRFDHLADRLTLNDVRTKENRGHVSVLYVNNEMENNQQVTLDYGYLQTRSNAKLRMAIYENGQIKNIFQIPFPLKLLNHNKHFGILVKEGLLKFNGELLKIPALDASPYALDWDESRTLIGTDKGLFILEDGKVKERYLESEFITAISVMEKDIIVCTQRSGVYFLKRVSKKESLPVFFNIRKVGNKIFAIADEKLYWNIELAENKGLFMDKQNFMPVKSTYNLLCWNDTLVISHSVGLSMYLRNRNGYTWIRDRAARYPYIKMLPSGRNVYFFQSADLIPHDRSTLLAKSYITVKTNDIRDIGVYQDTLYYSSGTHFHKLVSENKIVKLFKSDIRKFEFSDNRVLGVNNKGQLKLSSLSDGKVLKVQEGSFYNHLKKLDEKHFILSTFTYDNVLVEVRHNDLRVYPLYSHLQTSPLDRISLIDSFVFVCTDQGVYNYSLNQLKKSVLPPSIYFSNVTAGTKRYLGGNIQIPYAERNSLNIEVEGLYYGNEGYRYEYKPDNKSSWQPLSGGILSVSGLSFGKHSYFFRVKTPLGKVSKALKVTFVITNPFWARWWFVLLSVLFASLLLYFIIRLLIRIRLQVQERKFEEEKKFMNSEYKSMNALMNPHFIFNSLNNIQALVNKEDKTQANEYLEIFSRMVRQNMHNINDEEISLEKELVLVNNYIFLENLRYPDRFTFRSEVDAAVDLSEIYIPPLTLQPIIENSIKHGILPKKGFKGDIRLIIRSEREKIVIEVLDDGVGYTHSVHTKGNELALTNIEKRFALITKLKNRKITFSIGDREGEAGTRVGIIIWD